MGSWARVPGGHTLLRRCGRVKRMAAMRRGDPAVCAAASPRRQLRPPTGGWQAPWRLCVPVTPCGHPGAGFLARAGTRHARSAPASSLGAASTQWNNVRARLDRSLAGLSAGHKLSGVFFVQTVVSACFYCTACSVCVQWLADGVRPFSAPLTCCSRALLWPSARWMGIPARRRRGGVSSQKRPTARSAAEVAGGRRGLVTVT